ncbi:hypothetical protein K0F45_22700 [Bacteroides ovatus]|jgi:hypothetical protein|uniref:hypothetical protein n=1 Tax=Bacteroides TaxID=816 RepID=UPI000EF66731|nr:MULTISPECIES: hypothetical protein [Bacteroides]MCE8979907.1 hypothetical protein [Bacteroides ovatus]
MKIINVSVDIESQRLNSQQTLVNGKLQQNEDVSTQKEESKTSQKRSRKTKGTQLEKLRPDTDRVSNET